MTAGGQAIGLDVGGTKIAAARVAADGSILAKERVASPAADPAAILDATVDLAREVLTDDVVAIGMGAAGLVDSRTGVLAFAPNLAWRNVPLAAHVGGAIGLPVTADNDATVAAWGEYRFGAGRGSRHLLLVTVGTGIGGGIVTDGRIYRGAHGLAAEIGHIIVEPGGPTCGCGNQGCWEQVASGQAIQRAGRQAAERYPHSGIARLAEGVPARVTGSLVTRAAQDGDATARSILAQVGRRLGEGIAGLVNVLDPDVVVVGGGASAAGGLLLEPARRAFGRAVEAPDDRPKVPLLEAELGNDAGVVGAAALALDGLGAADADMTTA
jgi:glucokinase